MGFFREFGSNSFLCLLLPINSILMIKQVGHKMMGCKINSRIAPISQLLHNGDIVEIITSDNQKGPSMDWLKFVKSSSAKTKIQQWFKKAQRAENKALRILAGNFDGM